jgi:hypothetical protein
MLGVDRDNHDGILASLAFVDGHRIGEHQFIEFVEVIGDFSFIDTDNQFLLDIVDPDNAADVAVEDVLVIVIDCLCRV